MQCNVLACGCRFTCVQLPFLFFFFLSLYLGISCVASAPCQCPCMLALGHTLAHTCTRHQAAGRRQLCSLKGKVNSCAGDSWSSHDIPSPNIRDGLGRNGVSAERGPFTTWTRRRGFSLRPGWSDRAQFFLLTFPVIMWEVMSFSLVCSPYNSPPFASKQAQWSKLDNVVPVKNDLNANVYLQRSSFDDSSSDSHQNLVSLFTIPNLILNNTAVIHSGDRVRGGKKDPLYTLNIKAVDLEFSPCQ